MLTFVTSDMCAHVHVACIMHSVCVFALGVASVFIASVSTCIYLHVSGMMYPAYQQTF